MVKWLAALLLTGFCALGQTAAYTVYFDTDSFAITTSESRALHAFADSVNALSPQNIEITGWCDDTGTHAYNMALSLKRAKAVAAYFNNPKVAIYGEGELPVNDTLNVAFSRLKNRRVHIVVQLAPNAAQSSEKPPVPVITPEALATQADAPKPAIYKTYKDKLEPGDKILLKNLVFVGGRTKLTGAGRRELEKLLDFLKENDTLHFEIQGHVCCITNVHQDAVDEDTGKPNLSFARARYIYDFLVAQGIAASRMTFQGYGRQQPIEGGYENDNKRVEILIR